MTDIVELKTTEEINGLSDVVKEMVLIDSQDETSSGIDSDDYAGDILDTAPTRNRQVPDDRQPTGEDFARENTDARLFGKKSKVLHDSPSPRRRYIAVEEAFEYNMTHRRRGRAIIINNRNFEDHTGMDHRQGSDVDADSLLRSFGRLGFESYRYDDLSVYEINDLIEKVSLEDHSDCDCLAITVLSHGDEDYVYGTDGPVSIDALTRFFKGNKCPTLAGKPKLFFIQACRGYNYDDGVEVKNDSHKGGSDEVDAGRPQRIPIEADFLICYATVNGYYSWRNPTNGSWFVQSICHVMDHCGASMDMLRMMTRVSKMVAYGYESNTGEELKHMNKKKQIPCIVSMLTKDMYFPPKSSIPSNLVPSSTSSFKTPTRC
ncbi:caspase-7-like [Glandiceps talaboti]